MAAKKNRSSKRRATSRRTVIARTANRRTNRPSTRRAKGSRPWTNQEIAFLRKNYRNNSTTWCARQLGRTVYAVRYKASDLSIKKAAPSVWRKSAKPTFAAKTNRVAKTRWFAQTTTRRTRMARRRSH